MVAREATYRLGGRVKAAFRLRVRVQMRRWANVGARMGGIDGGWGGREDA